MSLDKIIRINRRNTQGKKKAFGKAFWNKPFGNRLYIIFAYKGSIEEKTINKHIPITKR